MLKCMQTICYWHLDPGKHIVCVGSEMLVRQIIWLVMLCLYLLTKIVFILLLNNI